MIYDNVLYIQLIIIDFSFIPYFPVKEKKLDDWLLKKEKIDSKKIV